MNALDRYLNTVSSFLPGDRRDEIMRQLSQALASAMRTREAELGRPLNESEREQVLDEHGTPIEVATRYFANQRRLVLGIELIGPALFHLYTRVLCSVVGLTILGGIAAAVVKSNILVLRAFMLPVGIQFICITAIFMIVQRAQCKHRLPDRWKPDSIPHNDLLSRYLHAVRFWLPAAQQDDITAELAEDLRSRIEDRGTELGRPVGESDIAAILRERGRPMLVASSYLSRQQLIGPALLPAYWFLLKLVVLYILVPVHLAIQAPFAMGSSETALSGLAQTGWTLMTYSVFAVGVLTIIFATLERFPSRRGEWDPRTLAPVTPPYQPRSRILAALETIVVLVLAGAWVSFGRRLPVWEIGQVVITPDPVWTHLFWPILVMLLTGLIAAVVDLLRPDPPRLRAGVRVVSASMTLIVLAITGYAGTWVEVSSLASGPNRAADVAKGINLGIWIAILLAGFMVVLNTIPHVQRILRRHVRGVPLTV